MSTPACKDGPILDHPNGRRAKSKRGHTDDFIEPFSPEERVAICTCAFGITFVIYLCLLIVLCVGAAGGTANVSQRPGDLFVRLVGTRGLLDPRGSPPTSPAFRLALDIDRTPPTYRSCSGGGNSWLRISYHDMILAWAQVPHFCVYGNRGVGSVGTLEVEAKADASVLREEVRNLLWSEIQVVGKVEFDVDGEVAGLGYLRCKFFIMEDKAADVPKSLCILRQ
uniref:Late embryogenesis abundant protein LEA-2 subgroup domain-containing protein n=1 Tax=Aegilops tauschii subsp. strangulata TaxID=200361 RepID=A0A453KVH8_AEGTS